MSAYSLTEAIQSDADCFCNHKCPGTRILAETLVSRVDWDIKTALKLFYSNGCWLTGQGYTPCHCHLAQLE